MWYGIGTIGALEGCGDVGFNALYGAICVHRVVLAKQHRLLPPSMVSYIAT